MAYTPLKVDEQGLILEDVPCSECNQSLKGANPGGYCPNCGAVNALSLLGRAGVHLDAQGRIDEPVVCLTCGHPLIGVEPTGVCPECESPVGPALEADLLRYCNGRWLKKVADGLLLYFIAMVLGIVLGLSGGVLALIFKNDPTIRTVIGMTVTTVTGILTIIAVWMVTAPDPDTALPMQKRGGANLARYLVMPQYLIAIPYILYANAQTTAAGQMKANLMNIPVGLLGMLVSIGVVLHLLQLSRRAVDEALERWSKIVLWLNVIGAALVIAGFVVLVATVVITGFTPGTGSSGTQMQASTMLGMATGGFGACIGSLLALVAMIWLAVLIFKLRTHYGRASKVAAHRA